MVIWWENGEGRVCEYIAEKLCGGGCMDVACMGGYMGFTRICRMYFSRVM